MVLHLGEGDSTRPKTPTLLQYLQEHGKSTPKVSVVTFVFFPGRAPNYSLLVDADYRINIHKSSSLYELFNDKLSTWVEQEIALLVLPNLDDRKGTYSLALDEKRKRVWEEREWGYKLNSPD